MHVEVESIQTAIDSASGIASAQMPFLLGDLCLMPPDLEHDWTVRVFGEDFGVWQGVRSDSCTLVVGGESFLIPLNAPAFVASGTSLLLAIGLLLIAGSKLTKNLKQA